MKVKYVVATCATEALESADAHGSRVVAELKRIEDHGDHDDGYRLYMVDESSTVAVALETTGYGTDIAIELPWVDSDIRDRVAQYVIQMMRGVIRDVQAQGDRDDQDRG